jgi:hypothetical protein
MNIWVCLKIGYTLNLVVLYILGMSQSRWRPKTLKFGFNFLGFGHPSFPVVNFGGYKYS